MQPDALRGWVQLMRPANLPTAAADIVAGSAIAAGLTGIDVSGLALGDLLSGLLYLVGSSVFLYAGGVVLNDVFDAETDRKERPERPIPRGAVTQRAAGYFGALLLLAGVAAAAGHSLPSAAIAAVLALSILAYDAVAKKHAFFGPLAMGLCRSLNLWLGMSLVSYAFYPAILAVPLVYIFAVTTVSRDEVDGGRKKPLILAGILYAIVIFSVGILVAYGTGHLLYTLPFMAIFGLMVFRPLAGAFRDPSPEHIRKAVKWGVIGIIALDACWAAGMGTWWLGVVVLALLPLSRALARGFAVT